MSNFYTNALVCGNQILYRGVENGKRVRRKVTYGPTFYVTSKDQNSKLRTLYDEPVEEFKLGSIKDARDFLKQYKDVKGFTIYGMPKYDYTFISDNYKGEIAWDISKLVIANIDIEVGPESSGGYANTTTTNGEVLSIAMYLGTKMYIFGCGVYVPENPEENYIKCDGEQDLLRRFLDVWSGNYPDVITGWNVNGYDVPYLVNRIKKVLGEDFAKILSPWGMLQERETEIMNKTQVFHEIKGIAILDYMELFRKFHPKGASQESYKLDDIAFNELGERKISYTEYDNFFQLYKNDFQKFIRYNIRDIVLVQRFEKKLKLIYLALTMAYNSKVNFTDVFWQTRMWSAIIYNYLRERDIVIHYKETRKLREYEGAFVKPPLTGLWKWVASLDLKSLYPSLMEMYGISPENLVRMDDPIPIDDIISRQKYLEDYKREGYAICPNGAVFRTDRKGFLGDILNEMSVKRDAAKNKMLAFKKEKEAIDAEIRKRGLTPEQ